MIFWAQFCRKTISFRPALSQKFPQMARTGSFAALLCENSGRRAKFPGKLPRSILKAAIPVERAQVIMASYRNAPCVSPFSSYSPCGRQTCNAAAGTETSDPPYEDQTFSEKDHLLFQVRSDARYCD